MSKALNRTRCAVAVLAVLVAIPVAGCGGSGRGAETDPEKGSDAEILNAALSEELTLLDAYTRGMPMLKRSIRPLGRKLRAQEQEYVDALTKALRGLGGKTDAEKADIDLADVRSQADFLTFAYGLESAALASDLDAAPRLFTDAPRTLATSLAAGHAQHLVVLREGLGAGPAASIPEAFDTGEVAPPGGSGPGGGE